MKKIVFNIKQLLVLLFRLFYSFISNGEKCIICGKQTVLLPVCAKCRGKLFNVHKVLSYSRCKICGQELLSSEETCMCCRENPVLKSTDQVLPLFSYRLWNKELLFKWKIKGERVLSPFFARLFFEALKELNQKVVVPVPPRKGKIKQNGWDQIDEVCQFLEYRYGIKIKKLLERNSVKQQKKLNREERLNTIQGAYSLVKNPGKLPDQVCLIDDVCTTGSTVECCSKILKEAGVKVVNVITLFIVD